MTKGANTQQELQILQAVIEGNQSAWNAFYKRYERLMLSCIRKVLLRYGVRADDNDMSDFLNSACVELIRSDYKKLRAYDPEKGYKISSWVGLIATNATHDALRKRGPNTVPIDSPDSGAEQVVDVAPSPTELAILKEQQDIVNQAIFLLKPSEQRFIQYYYIDQLDPAEIAEILQININTVYSRKSKIRATLYALVKEFIKKEELFERK